MQIGMPKPPERLSAERIVAVLDALASPTHPARQDPEMAGLIESASLRTFRLARSMGQTEARRKAAAEAVEALASGTRAFPNRRFNGVHARDAYRGRAVRTAPADRSGLDVEGYPSPGM